VKKMKVYLRVNQIKGLKKTQICVYVIGFSATATGSVTVVALVFVGHCGNGECEGK
jgi:hypothetical protein